MNKHEPKFVKKSWGHELWIHNSPEYCGKLLVFPKLGDSFSMHYHLKKTESWYVQQGCFVLQYVDTETTETKEMILNEGDCVDISRGQPHKLTSLENDSIIFEVSTEHFDEDSYRIWR